MPSVPEHTRQSIVKAAVRLFAEKGYAEQMKSFFEALRQGTPPAVTVHDGARVTIGCLCMLESAKEMAFKEINLEASLV